MGCIHIYDLKAHKVFYLIEMGSDKNHSERPLFACIKTLYDQASVLEMGNWQSYWLECPYESYVNRCPNIYHNQSNGLIPENFQNNSTLI